MLMQHAFSQPTITTFAPSSGHVGTNVVITGTNFSPVTANNIVYFGPIKANITASSAVSLTVTVPAGAAYQPITVTVNGLTAYSAKPFLVTFASADTITTNSFAPKVDIAGIVNLAPGDFDGDGKTDIAATQAGAYNSSLAFYRNNSIVGHDSLTPGLVLGGVGSDILATGDFNGDGKLDLVSVYRSNNLFNIFKNNSTPGNIQFAQVGGDYATPYNPSGVAVGDLNGDGKPDIALCNYGAGTMSVYINTTTAGTISFAPGINFAAGSSPTAIAIADINGDGKPDIAVTNSVSASILIYQNITTGTTFSLGMPVSIATPSGPQSIAVADMDGDGIPDLVTANYYPSTVSVIKNVTVAGTAIQQASFKSSVDYVVGTHPYAASVADLDGDGKLDITAANINSNILSVLKNTSTNAPLFTAASFAPGVPLTTANGPVNVTLFDLDGDSKPDIFASNLYSISVSVFRNLLYSLSASISGTATACLNSTAPSVTFTCTNGAAPYKFVYSINGGAALVVTTTVGNSVKVTAPTTVKGSFVYILTSVTDGNGMVQKVTGAAATVTIDMPGASMVITQPLCAGGTNGSVVLTGNGGTNPYQYNLTPSTAYQASGLFSGLKKGSYVFSVKDASACAGTVTVVLTEPTLLTANLTAGTLCFGSNNTLTATGGGGTAPYQYSLNNGPKQASNIFNGQLAGGAYTLQVTDANACTASKILAINTPVSALSATATITNITCNGNANGSVTVKANGGYPSLYAYAQTASGPFQSTGKFTGLAPGQYNFVVKDSGGCTSSVVATITQPTPLTANLTAGTLCFGSNNTLTATGGGGTAPYQYSLNNGTKQTSNIFNGQLAGGTYTLQLTDANACTASKTLAINAPASALSATVTIANINCNGNANGSVTVKAIGGYASSYVYAQSATGPFQATGNFTGLAPASYNFVVKDSGGCTASVAAVITQPAVLKTVLAAGKLCFDSTATLTATTTGGTAPYLYSLNGGVQQPSAVFNNQSITGNYAVSVVDAHGCSAASSIAIKAPASALKGSVTIINDTCYGYTNGSITAKGIGGYPPYQYKTAGFPVYQSSGKITGLATGGYLINIKDSGGCVVNVSAVVTQPAPVTVYVKANALCLNVPTTYVATASGGTAPYLYSFNGGAKQPTGLFSGQPSAGSFIVSTTDVNGCKGSNSFTIKPPASALTATAQITNASCYGSTNGLVVIKAAGGYASSYQYQLSPSTTYQASNTFTALTAGTKTFVVRDSGGCGINVTAIVGQPALLQGTIASSGLCFSGTTTLTTGSTGGTAPYQYSLNGGAYQAGATYPGKAAGTYNLAVKDAHNCTGTGKLVIVAPTAALKAQATFKNATGTTATGSATITATGGVAPYRFRKGINPYQSSGVFTNLVAAIYIFSAMDANGCVTTVTVTIKSVAGLNAGDEIVTGESVDQSKQSDNGLSLNLTAYPNPSSNYFTLTLQNADANAGAEIRVMDMSGKVIYHTRGTPWQQFRFGEGFINGLYLVEAINGRKIKTIKLIKTN